MNKKIKEQKNDVYGRGLSLIEEEKDKCLITFPIRRYSEDSFDEDLGLLAVLRLNKIFYRKIYIRPLKDTSKNSDVSTELVYEFDKKSTKEIVRLEKEYFQGKSKIAACILSELIINEVNNLSPENWRDCLISRYKEMILLKKNEKSKSK